MSSRGGFIAYPDGTKKRIKGLQKELTTHFENQTIKERKKILDEILDAYAVYYMSAIQKPTARSNALRECQSMVGQAQKMLKSIESMNDPVSIHYDMWMHRNGKHGLLTHALKDHINASYWTERQLEKEPASNPQPKAEALKKFKSELEYIFKKYNPKSKTPDFNDNSGSFVADVLEAFRI